MKARTRGLRPWATTSNGVLRASRRVGIPRTTPASASVLSSIPTAWPPRGAAAAAVRGRPEGEVGVSRYRRRWVAVVTGGGLQDQTEADPEAEECSYGLVDVRKIRYSWFSRLTRGRGTPFLARAEAAGLGEILVHGYAIGIVSQPKTTA